MICVRVLGTVAGEINRFVLDLFSNWEVSEKKKEIKCSRVWLVKY